MKSLCEGKPPQNATLKNPHPGVAGLLHLDFNVVAAVLKAAKYPEPNKSIVTGGDKESPKSEIKRSRSDLSTVIFQQLTAPLEAGKNSWSPLSDEITDCAVSC